MDCLNDLSPTLATAVRAVAALPGGAELATAARRAIDAAQRDARPRRPGVLERLVAAGWPDAARALLLATLEVAGGVDAAAEALGLSRMAFYRARVDILGEESTRGT